MMYHRRIEVTLPAGLLYGIASADVPNSPGGGMWTALPGAEFVFLKEGDGRLVATGNYAYDARPRPVAVQVYRGYTLLMNILFHVREDAWPVHPWSRNVHQEDQ